jgi:hypothetical protein
MLQYWGWLEQMDTNACKRALEVFEISSSATVDQKIVPIFWIAMQRRNRAAFAARYKVST